jgi:hypothetical protein
MAFLLQAALGVKEEGRSVKPVSAEVEEGPRRQLEVVLASVTIAGSQALDLLGFIRQLQVVVRAGVAVWLLLKWAGQLADVEGVIPGSEAVEGAGVFMAVEVAAVIALITMVFRVEAAAPGWMK